MDETRIRNAARPEDWDAIREIICSIRAPNQRERWGFLGEILIAPYEILRPKYCWVAEAEGEVIGYVTGSPDTEPFERSRWLRMELPVLLSIATGRYARNPDTLRFARHVLGLSKKPYALFPRSVRARLRLEYPAHLHMNLRERAIRRKIGSQLVHAFENQMQSEGVPGIHALVGGGVAEFGKALGYTSLHGVKMPSGEELHAMVRRID